MGSLLVSGYTRESANPLLHPELEKIDLHDKVYGSHVIFYIFCGLLDSMWQTAAYWMMGAMSNDPAKLAHFTGFYKSIQSAGGAGTWRADGQGLPYMTIFASTWAILTAGLVFMLPMIYMRVYDHQEEMMYVFLVPNEWCITDDVYSVTVAGTDQVVAKNE
jgi:roadblock/LC7 domain-containing protein